MTYHTEKIETAIAKIHECLDAPIDPVRVRRLLKDIGKWSAEAEREAYARGKADVIAQLKPIAYMTRDDEGEPSMLFFDLDEARTYCNPDEEPARLALIPEN